MKLSENIDDDAEGMLSMYTGGNIVLTIFDLEQIVAALKSTSFQPDIVLGQSSNKIDSNLSKYWENRINRGSITDWESALRCPLEEAAVEILTLHNDNERDAKQDTMTYLHYHASEILRAVCEIDQHSLKQRLQQQNQELHQLQTCYSDVEQRYNTSFDQWDDYCKNVLKVESDALPLCPLNKHDDEIFDDYIKDIETCVRQSLRDEFKSLSERFVEGCYREDIVQAIDYYHNFTEFVSQRKVFSNSDSMLKTLNKFTSGVDISSCLSQFRTSPAARVQLVSDLQQLDIFLSCRKKDIAAASSRGFGHNIAEAIDVEWNQFNIEKSTNMNAGVSPHDVDRFQQATYEVLKQIVGEGAQAKRLRLLSDAVGYSSTEESPRILYLKAGKLSLQMTVLDDQSKLLVQSIKKAEKVMEMSEKDLKKMENRIQYISERLKAIIA